MDRPSPVLRITDLAVSFPSDGGGRAMAVDGVSLDLVPRRTHAVVGESGSGKSMTALAAMGLLPGTARVERGRIDLAGSDGAPRDMLSLSPAARRRLRGAEIAMIFQEPMTSLNPVFTVGEQIVEAVRLHRPVSAREARDIAGATLREAGIENAQLRLDQFPHEFSGGMRQRVMIAIALVCRPRVLLADEPTTALDVTVQAQVLALLAELKASRNLAVMLITHDLGLVARYADDVSVMYAGRIVEHGPADAVLRHPLHPYTRCLLRCAPRRGSHGSRLATVTELLTDEREFAPLAGSRPWWPAHAERADLRPSLREIEPEHAVAVWA